MKQVLKEAYRMMESTPDDINPLYLMEHFTPLTKGQYPVFNKYPKFIIDYQVIFVIIRLPVVILFHGELM